jgi:DNA-binding PadR family transcriptional regulator
VVGLRRSKAKPNSRIFILNDFYTGGRDLLLYDGYEEKYHAFGSFLEYGLKHNELCGYFYPNEAERLTFNNYLGHYSQEVRGFPITNGHVRSVREQDIEGLRDKINSLLDEAVEYSALRIQIDFGKTMNSRNMDAILKLVEDLHGIKEFPLSTLMAFSAADIDQGVVNRLIKLHDRAMLSTKDETCVTFSQLSRPKGFDAAPSVDVITTESMEQAIKKSLDIIVLALLQQRPMCGFDIIKTIVQNFSVLLSQGTVYPILYSLKDKGYVDIVMRSDNKTRVYVPTAEGRRYMEEKIKEYILAQENILNLIGKGLEEHPIASI